MKKIVVGMMAASVLVVAAPVMAIPDCTCKEIKSSGSGWCEDCNKGVLYGVSIPSGKLYHTLAGVKMEPKSMKCKGCALAMKEDGVCKSCNVSFYEGKAYRSFVSHALAHGHVASADKIECAGCRKAMSSGEQGYCKGCNVGFVNRLAFHGKDSFEEAGKSMKILTSAASSKCEACAIGLVTNGKCEDCKVQFKNGIKSKT